MEYKAEVASKRQAGLVYWKHRPIAAAYWQMVETYRGWKKERRHLYERKVLLILLAELRNCFIRMADYSYTQPAHTKDRLERVLGAIDILLLGWAGKSLATISQDSIEAAQIDTFATGELGRTWATYEKTLATIQSQS
jgi:hypothetical protein